MGAPPCRDPAAPDRAAVKGLVSLNERTSLDEVADIYLPLSRLLNLCVPPRKSSTARPRHFSGRTVRTFRSSSAWRAAWRSGSTASRLLKRCSRDGRAIRSGSGHDRRIPAAARDAGGQRAHASQGLPESYDVRRLVHFMAELKSGPSAGASLFTPAVRRRAG